MSAHHHQSQTVAHSRALVWAGGVLVALLVLLPAVFSAHMAEPFEEVKVLLLQAGALLLGGLLLAEALGPRPRSSPARRATWASLPQLLRDDPILTGFLLLALSACLSTAWSISPSLSWRGDHVQPLGLKAVLAYLVLFLAARHLCGDGASARRVLTAALLGAGVAAGYAVVQAVQLDPIAWGDTSRVHGRERVFGTLGHANILGGYLALVLPVLCWQAQRARSAGRRLVLTVLVFTGLLAGVALVLTLSRAAWLAAGCGLIVFLLGGRRQGRGQLALVACLAVVVGLLLVLLALPQAASLRAALVERLHRLADSPGRWGIWRAAWGVFLEHPLLGSGLDTLRLAFGAHRPVDYLAAEGISAVPSRAHNEPLQVLATQGLVGAGALLYLVVGLARAIPRAWKAGPDQRPLLLVAGAVLAAFGVQALVGFTLVPLGALLVVVAAILSRASRPEAGPTAELVSSDSFAVALSAAACLALLALLASLGFSLGFVLILGVCVGLAFSLVALERPSVSAIPLAARCHPLGTPARAPWLRGGALLASLGVIGCVVLPPLLATWKRGEASRLDDTDPARAAGLLREAIDLDPGCDRAWTELGGMLQLQARRTADPLVRDRLLGEARRALEHAVRLSPADAYHHATLGRFLGELALQKRVPSGLADLALVRWDAALEREPRDAVLLAEAVRTALAVGRLARAGDYLSRGRHLYPELAVFQALDGARLYRLGQTDAAMTALAGSLHADWRKDGPELARALNLLGVLQLEKGRLEHAEVCASWALPLDPGSPTPHLILGQVHHRRGDARKAEQAFRRVLELAPRHPAAQAALAQMRRPPR